MFYQLIKVYVKHTWYLINTSAFWTNSTRTSEINWLFLVPMSSKILNQIDLNLSFLVF